MHTYTSRFFTVTLLLLLSINSSAQMKWRISSVVNAVYKNDSSGKLVYLPQDSTIYFFNNQNNRGSSVMNDTIHCDGFDQYKIAPGAVLKYNQTGHYIYNSNGELETLYRTKTTQGVTDTIGKEEFRYAQGFLIKHQLYTANSSSPSLNLNTQTEYSYSAKGQLTEERRYTGVTSHLYEKRFIAYNSNGQIETDSIARRSGNNWIWDELRAYTYNAANENIYSRYWLPPGCGTMMIEYYDHADDGLKTRDSLFFWGNVNKPNNGAKITEYTYTKDGKPKEVIGYNGNGASKTVNSKTSYEYTSFGYISSITTTRLGTNGVAPTHKTSYNYQHYWPADVADIHTGKNGLSVYPVPATDMLNIQLAMEKGAEITGAILNPMGQQVQAWNDKANGEYQKQVLIQSLPPGQYFLKLSTQGKTYTKPFLVIRN